MTFQEQERLQGFEHGVLSTLELFKQAAAEINEKSPVVAMSIMKITEGLKSGLSDAFTGEPLEEAPKRFTFTVINGGKE